MSKQLIINLPVSDPQASKDFYSALGLSLNKEMTDEKATCFNLEDNILIALLPKAHFEEVLSGNRVADTTTHETLLAIGVESKQAVDDLADKASAAGATELHEPYDLPEIYGRTFKDLDNHLWNVFYFYK